MARLDLSAEAPAFAVTLPPEQTPSEVELRLAQSTWRGRMVNEHASARVFAQLVPQLMRAEVSPALQASALDMAQDELRHARQCAGVLVSLGAEAEGELPALVDLPAHEDAESPLEVVLRNVMSICCLSETVAVALIDAERRALDGNPLSQVLKTILADEVQHARFGWSLFAEVPLDDALRTRLSAYLECALEHLESHELAHLAPVCAPVGAQALGACDGTLAREILYSTIREVIVPGFARYGIAADPSWGRRSTPSMLQTETRNKLQATSGARGDGGASSVDCHSREPADDSSTQVHSICR